MSKESRCGVLLANLGTPDEPTPAALRRYLGDRDVINHVHYRNVYVRKPNVDYTEVFPDNGQVNMFAVMKELVRQKYPRGLYPEHARALDIDRRLGIKTRIWIWRPLEPVASVQTRTGTAPHRR